MLGKLAGWDDTIVALATAPGLAAIAMIRLSGEKSISIVNELFPAKDLLKEPTHTLHVGYLRENGNLLDEVVVGLYKAPGSYTGEDIAEVSCHGSPYIQEKIIEAFLEKGARMAKPGEFTQRAFLHGKLDLTQAEAVADLIASNTAASKRAALHSLRGGFSQDLQQLRERLLRFSALIELELDFSQEDVEFADRQQLRQLIEEAATSTDALLQSFQLGNVITKGVQAAIVGKPNAGKSTLLNALLNEKRAIVSEIAGTTRDTVEEVISIEGILFRLIDTAGIRQHTSGTIEQMGVARTIEKIEQVDLVIYLFDVQDDRIAAPASLATAPDHKNKIIFVANKSDTLAADVARKKFPDPGILFISARNGHGIDTLKKALADRILQGKTQTEGTIITHARHYEALQQVHQSLMDIRKLLSENLPGDLLALDIRRCLHWLGEITGEVTNEEQLGYIFGKFCIGK